MNKINMLVIGIDGACWPLIIKMIDAGELPNIKNLRENGVWGDMKSCIPPITYPAWKCYSTGKNPGKLGVFWWEYLDIENKKSIIPDSRSFDSKEIWDYLNDKDITTGIIGMPTTYPPKKVKGFMISGGPDVGEKDFTYPKSIEKEVKDKYGYFPNFFDKIIQINEENKQKVADICLKQIDSNFKTSVGLYEKEKPDFLQVCTYTINGPLQHFFYDDEPTKKAWRVVDSYIGLLKDKFQYVIIHSDHGTSPMKKQFFINAWFKKEGYLFRKKSLGDFFIKIGLDRILNFLEKTNLSDLLIKLKIFQSFSTLIPDKKGLFGETEGKAIFQKVDWKKSKVVGSAQGPIYLNNSILTEDEKSRLKDEIIRKLESFKDPETGKNPIDKVYRREDIYSGKYTNKAPELIALDSDEYHNKGGIRIDVLFRESIWKGNNSINGLFVISGKDIKKGKNIDIEIFDLAPTILHIFGLPVPTDIDGKVLKEIFEENSDLSRRIVNYKKNDEKEEEIIKKSIKKLKGTGRL
ncbi:hypothetical protein AYK20_02510 [Thermoplasmatales archaeon SG8-52-1]|nr:MAG: hypothetical protein AYK20_02510 [Thermoplasmatales archaeon SG8-52-1]